MYYEITGGDETDSARYHEVEMLPCTDEQYAAFKPHYNKKEDKLL